MVWAYLLDNTGAFTNPFEYREVMCSIIGYSDKTVAEVEAEQKKRHEERDRKSKSTTRGAKEPPVAGAATPAPSEMEKFQQLLAVARENALRKQAEEAPTPKPRAPRKPRPKKTDG